jgi:uncharacterized membrane protein SpoIIM required for sporulation
MTRRALLKTIFLIISPWLVVGAIVWAVFVLVPKSMDAAIDSALRAEAEKRMKPELEKAFAKEMEERYGKPTPLP